jgi:hypothetical protein
MARVYRPRNPGTNVIYEAPELIAYEIKATLKQSSIRPLKEPLDVYAIGMLIFEVILHVLFNVEWAQCHTRFSPGDSPSPDAVLSIFPSMETVPNGPHGRQIRSILSGTWWNDVGCTNRRSVLGWLKSLIL